MADNNDLAVIDIFLDMQDISYILLNFGNDLLVNRHFGLDLNRFMGPDFEVDCLWRRRGECGVECGVEA